MNPHRRKRFQEVEEAYGMPFWDFVRQQAARGATKEQVAGLVGYSPTGFSKLLKTSDAPEDIPWALPGKRRASGRTEPVSEEARARIRAGIQRTRSAWVEYKGRVLPLVDLAEETGIPLETLRKRWKNGKREERLVEPPMPPQEKGRLGMAIRYGQERSG